MKYLVELMLFESNRSLPITVCDNREKAKEFIDKRMEDGRYSGMGKFIITKISYYN